MGSPPTAYLELLNLTLSIQFEHLTKISSGDGRGDESDRAHKVRELRSERLNDVRKFLSCSLYAFEGLFPKCPGAVSF